MGRCPVRPWAPGRKLGQRDRCRVEPRLQRLFRHRLGQRPDNAGVSRSPQAGARRRGADAEACRDLALPQPGSLEAQHVARTLRIGNLCCDIPSLLQRGGSYVGRRITQRCPKRRPQAWSPARYGGSPSFGTVGRHASECWVVMTRCAHQLAAFLVQLLKTIETVALYPITLQAGTRCPLYSAECLSMRSSEPAPVLRQVFDDMQLAIREHIGPRAQDCRELGAQENATPAARAMPRSSRNARMMPVRCDASRSRTRSWACRSSCS